MIIKYDTDQLKRIIDDIFEMTGVSLAVLDTEYNSLTRRLRENDFCSFLQESETERRNCYKCDSVLLEKCNRSGRLEKHICKCGLYDAAVPIIKCEAIVGFVIMGRVRSENSPESPKNIPTDDTEAMKKFKALYDELPFLAERRIDALYDLFSFILFDKAIQIIHDPLTAEILDFINLHFCEKISIEGLCSKFHISKNRLYKIFNDNLATTVNQYIAECRLKNAKIQLSQSDKTVYQIAQEVGIDNYTYFCRLFKKMIGVTPIEYRKKAKTEVLPSGIM